MRKAALYKERFTLFAGVCAACWALSGGGMTVRAAENTALSENLTAEDAVTEAVTDDAAESNGETAAQDADTLPADETDETGVTEISLTLDRQTLLLAVGEQTQLSVAVYPPDALLGAVSWQTNNASVLTVSETGLLTAVAPGQANVTVSTADGAHTAKCAVAVYPADDLETVAEAQTNWTRKGFYRAIADLKDRTSPWKSVLCIGDSVTAGVQAGEGKLQWIPNYPLTMSSLLNIPVFNHGVGGSSIWSGGNYHIIDSLANFEEADAVFLLGGYNDWFYGVECPIGDAETPGTFTYDFNALCDKIAEIYPDADVFVVLPPTPHDHVGIEPYYDFSWLKAIERESAEAHGFYVLNLPAEDILNGLEEETWNTFFSDNVHLNDYGYLVLGTIITDKALIAREEASADVADTTDLADVTDVTDVAMNAEAAPSAP